MAELSLSELGWQPFFDQQVSLEESQSELIARVFAHHGSQIVFRSESGEFSAPTSIVEPNNELQYSEIAVGDWFLLAKDSYRCRRRLERKTLLARKAAGEEVKPQLIAANIDTAFIVSSCNQDFNLSRIERYLALVLEAGANPVVVLTKADLCDDPADLRQQVEKIHPGLIVETLDARDPGQTQILHDWCKTGKTVALLGSSGVGKSTLANALGGLSIKTHEIREDDAKGRHTTTARSIYRLQAGGWLIDNPGMRELQLGGCEEGLNELFDDILILSQQCRFRDCQHQSDPGCAIRAAIEAGEMDERRLISFRKLLSEQRRNASSLAERRRSERQLGKYYKNVISQKTRLRENQ